MSEVTYSEHMSEGIFDDNEISEALLDSIFWDEKFLDVDTTTISFTEEEIRDESVPSNVEGSEGYTRMRSESTQVLIAPLSPPALPYWDQSEENAYLEINDIDLVAREWNPSYTDAAWNFDKEDVPSQQLAEVEYSSTVGSFSTRTLSHPSFYSFYTALSTQTSANGTEQEATRRTQEVPVISHHDFYYTDPLLPGGHRLSNHLSEDTQKVFGSFRLNTPHPVMSVCEMDSVFSTQDADLPSSKDCSSVQLTKSPSAERADTVEESAWWTNLSRSEYDAVIALFQLQDQICTTPLPEMTVAVSGTGSQSLWCNKMSFKSAGALVCEQSVYRHAKTQAVMNAGEQLGTLLGEANGITTATDISAYNTESGNRSAHCTKLYTWRSIEELEAMCGLLQLCAKSMHGREAGMQDLTSKCGNMLAKVHLPMFTESMASICEQVQEEAVELWTSQCSSRISGTFALQQPTDCDSMSTALAVALSKSTESAQEPFAERGEMSHPCSLNEIIAITALLELHMCAEWSSGQNVPQCVVCWAKQGHNKAVKGSPTFIKGNGSAI